MDNINKDDQEVPASEKTDKRRKRIINKIKKWIRNLIPIVLFLLLWEIAPRIGLVDSVFITPFSIAVKAIFQMANTHVLFTHIGASLYRAFSGLALSVIIGLPLGIALGCSKKVQEFLSPLLNLFSLVSPMALFPVFIVLLGLGESSKIGIIFWSAVWPILLNTISVVAHVESALIKAAKVMGASRFWILIRVIFPSALPEIVPGLRISTSMSIVMLCAAEMLGATAGLGYLISYSQQIFENENMYAAIILIAILGLALNYVLTLFERKVLAWKEISKY